MYNHWKNDNVSSHLFIDADIALIIAFYSWSHDVG